MSTRLGRSQMPMSGGNAGGKEPCGMKERNRAQTGGGGTAEGLRGGGRFGLHRA